MEVIMSKYNTKREPVVKSTTTHQGGTGFTQKPEHELIGILATGMGNTYYEREGEREIRFKALISAIASKDAEFAAKALIYARSVFGQRSVTHFGAVELIPHLQGNSLGKKFFSKRARKSNHGGIIYRLDDMTEILAAYLQKNGSNASIPNSIKRGFKEAIEASDAYELAKYQAKAKTVSLFDIVNLVHPKETEKNGAVKIPRDEYLKATKGTKFQVPEGQEINDLIEVPALRALVLGILKQFNTAEDKNTEAGKVVAEKIKSGEITKEAAEVELKARKSDNFKDLIETKTIGYLALLRNLRNIIKTGDSVLLDKACTLLIEPSFVRNSLVWPHQIDLALEVMLTEFSGSAMSKVANALNTAYETAIPNLKELFPYGRTAVVFDSSGSMHTPVTTADQKRGRAGCLDKAALIAATLAKGLDADTYEFASRCQKLKYNPLDSVNSIKERLIRDAWGGGTNWSTIFPVLAQNGAYDRVFIMSDEQGADEVEGSYKSYCQQFGTPHVYVINLCGYGPVMMKQTTRVHRIAGYTADIYETAKKTEIDPEAIITEINAIRI
jgi:60 kDa SS-A/Ro ribonucleoprotein